MDSDNEIIGYLEDLAQVLTKLGVRSPFHLLVSGGAYMLLQQSRRATQDIDFALIARPVAQVEPNKVLQVTVQRAEISKRSSRVPDAQEFRQAVEMIAQQ